MTPDPSSTTPSGRAVCSLCGSQQDQPGLDWMFESDPARGVLWVCGQCARANVRAIEAKLEQEWW